MYIKKISILLAWIVSITRDSLVIVNISIKISEINYILFSFQKKNSDFNKREREFNFLQRSKWIKKFLSALKKSLIILNMLGELSLIILLWKDITFYDDNLV